MTQEGIVAVVIDYLKDNLQVNIEVEQYSPYYEDPGGLRIAYSIGITHPVTREFIILAKS